MKPLVVDLFAGAGGLSTGFRRAGFEIAFASDHWADAASTYRRNHPLTPFSTEDIHSLTGTKILGMARARCIDVVIGGPPCQGFSTLGKRDDDDPRNVLFEQFVRVVRELRPSAFVIENVAGILIANGGQVRKRVEAALESLGYDVVSEQLTSADYGVPQLRRRVFFVGILKDRFPKFCFPPSTHGPGPGLAPHVTVWDAIGDLPELKACESQAIYGKEPFCQYQKSRRKGTIVLSNHEAAHHCPKLVKTISFVPDGGNRLSIPPEYQPKSGFHNSYSRLSSTKPAVAVTSNLRKPSSARAIHPFQDRGLTVREGARLQSFDDDYLFCCSRTSQYLQIGNAVPPLLAEAVGRQLLQTILGGVVETHVPESRQLLLNLG